MDPREARDWLQAHIERVRAAQVALTSTRHLAALQLQSLENRLEEKPTTPEFTHGEHYYLSTSCFHGVHEHCRSTLNMEGGKKEPGTCKWCPAECICPCHHEAKAAELPNKVLL